VFWGMINLSLSMLEIFPFLSVAPAGGLTKVVPSRPVRLTLKINHKWRYSRRDPGEAPNRLFASDSLHCVKLKSMQSIGEQSAVQQPPFFTLPVRAEEILTWLLLRW
jgi:hypothetical protein